jgi:hypothetical protein
MTDKDFYFSSFINQLEFTFDTPYEIVPNHFIRKATHKEADFFQRKINRLCSLHPADLIIDYNVSLEIENNYIKTINNESWRYWIVEHRGNGDDAIDLRFAFLLSKLNLKLELRTQSNSGGFELSPDISNIYNTFQSIFNITKNFIKPITKEELEEVRQIYEIIKQDPNYNVLWGTKKNYRDIDSIPFFSNLRPLSFFIIWELLLAHKPDAKDPSDSITRQLKSKINLVNNRMTQKIDLKVLCGESTKFDTVISKLYSYRSAIIHGDKPDFKKDLIILKDFYTTELILREITRKLIIQAMIEPQLFKDLKDC